MKQLINFFTRLFSYTRKPNFTPKEGVNLSYMKESPERLNELLTYKGHNKNNKSNK